MKNELRFCLVVAALCCGAHLPFCGRSLAGDLTADNITVLNKLSVGGGATGVLPTSGSLYVIVEQNPTDNDQQRGDKLQAAYTKAVALSVLAYYRVTVLVPPGKYDLGTAGLLLSHPFINVVGMVPAQMTKRVTATMTTQWGPYLYEKTVPNTSANGLPLQCSVYLYGTGNVIRQTVDYIRIANLHLDHRYNGEYSEGSGDWDTAAYWPEGSFPNTIIEHVMFKTYSESGDSVSMAAELASGALAVYPGTYRDCVAGSYSFGWATTISGTFEDCVGGPYSFAGTGYPGATTIASGIFRNCAAGDYSFGGYNSATGLFKNCVGGNYCFGGSVGITSGVFENCIGGNYCFAGSNGNAPGRFKNCAAMLGSFWVWGGTFEGCLSHNACFHWNAASSSTTTFLHCKGGYGSFSPIGTPYTSGIINDYNSPRGDLSMGTFTQ